MHKDQYTDAPSQEQVRVKTMLNSTISMGYPDVVIACIEHGNDSNLLIVFYVQIMPDDLVMQLHRF